MVFMEHALNVTIRYPGMRLDVMSAVEALGDSSYQELHWGRVEEGVNRYDDLSLDVNILFDCRVLPDPAVAVGDVLYASEVASFSALGAALQPMIDDLGSRPELEYTRDPRWQAVLDAAGRARDAMRSSGQGEA